jgi:hypothetical protein
LRLSVECSTFVRTAIIRYAPLAVGLKTSSQG